MKSFFIILFLFLSSPLLAEQTFFCGSKELESFAIQQNGRNKPLYVHANETLKMITGRRGMPGKSAVESYCLISLKGLGLPVNVDLETPIEHVKIRELMELGEDEKRIPMAKLVNFEDDLRREGLQAKEDSPYRKAINQVWGKLQVYKEISSGTNWKVPELVGGSIQWTPLVQFFQEDQIQELSKKSSTPFLDSLRLANDRFKRLEGDKVAHEYTFAKMKLPRVAMILSILSLLFLTLIKRFHAFLTFSVITVIVQTIYIIFRIYISGRAPITNMYETVLFSGYGAMVLSLLIGWYKKEKTFFYMGMVYNILTLFMINFAHGMLNPNISPLVPVLRDNFWLSTHVTITIMSYGAFALSWILGNTILIKKKMGSIEKKDENYFSEVIYSCLKWGVVMLATGILLGGVWADYSWGRFWGWDPKETWSLIVLCIYMAILHGKYTAWINNARFVPLVTASFMSVMMAWFGVNYILATGLHSYGFSEGGALFLGTFFAIQIVILIFTWPRDEIKREAERKNNSVTGGAEA